MRTLKLVCACSPRYKVKSSDSWKFSDTKPYEMTYRKPNSKQQRSDEGHKQEGETVVAAGAGVQSELVTDPEFADLPQPLPPGFQNLGNTCYINTTLQCLLTVQPLLQWLLRVDKQGNSSSSSSSIPPDQRLTDSLSHLVAATFRRKYKPELQKFRELVGVLQPEFKEAREQDAQEFLLLLLNRLHEENVLPSSSSSPTAAAGSEVQRIFAGEMRTSVVCSNCRDPAQEKTSFFHRKPTSECSTGEVFLSLSLPIPLQEEQIDEATLGSDPRHLRHRIVLNELIQQPKTWRQRRLSFDSKATIENVYKQADALVAPAPASSTYARMAAASSSGGGAAAGSANVANAESVPASSTNLKTPFLLVQATTSGFGAWFLDETGLGANLVDGLDLEAICGPMDSSNLQTRQKNLIYGDSLFLVHLKNSWNTAVDDYPNGGADSMEVDDTDEEGGMLRILLIHVTESGKQEDEEEHAISDTYRAVGENAGPAPKFHRFSPPFLISVRSDIQFDELRKCATRALTDFLGCPPLEGDRAFEEDGLLEAFFGLRFWIVDAGPGEACEILDEPDCYPLLHPTVDLSSVPVPSWMLPTSNGSSSSQPLKLLRLLAVWPTAKLPPFPIPPPTPSYPLDKDPLALTTPPPGKRGRRSDSNARPSHSMHFSSSKGKHSANSAQPLSSAVPMDPPSTASSSAASSAEFTLNDCLKAFIESERPADDKWKCPRCARKNQSNPLLLTKLLNAPDYLLLHLNRFVQAPCSEGQDDATDAPAWNMRKIYSLVDYPIDGLDLSSIMANREKSAKSSTLPWFSGSKASPPSSLLYDLVAVCNHKGQLDSGHYTAICRNLFTNQWWHYSDQKVVKVSADQVVQASAYILFYRKRTACSSRELRSLRQTLAELARETLSTSPSVSPLSAEEPTASTGRAHHTATGPDLEGERGRSLQSPISVVQSPTDPVDTRRRRQTSSAAHSPWHSKADQAQPACEVGRDQPNVGDNVAQRQPPPLLPKPRADERKFQSVSTKPPSLLCDTDSDCVQGRRSSGVYRLTTPDNEGVKKLETSRPSPAPRHNSTVKMSKF